jgi:hypothetical protein
MARKFTRYFRDPEFKEAIDEQFALADVATRPGICITYAIHDPTRTDHIESQVDGLIIYVGQSKQFNRRIRKRMRDAGTAIRRPHDRIDGACYDIMARGGVPRFTVLEETSCVLDSLVSETNWAKRLRVRGYPLLNQWAEQKFAGVEIDRRSVPHDWLWPMTAADAIASNVDLVIVEGVQEFAPDLSTFPASMRLREIRDAVKASGRKVRLYVRDSPSRE